MELLTMMIEDQPLIAASLGLAVLPLILVVIMILAKAVKSFIAAILRMKTGRTGVDMNNAVEDAELPADDVQEAAPVPVVISPVATTLSAAESEVDEEDVISSAMQDLLNSVFDGEESRKRSDAILSDLKHINMRDLAMDCANVAHQARARSLYSQR